MSAERMIVYLIQVICVIVAVRTLRKFDKQGDYSLIQRKRLANKLGILGLAIFILQLSYIFGIV